MRRAPMLPRTALGSQGGDDALKDEWRLKVAHAVDVLQEDVPLLFASYNGMGGRLPDFSIYSSEINFVDERAPSFVLRGLPMYRNFLLALRWSIRSMFEESKLEITAMGKTLSVDGKLSMRWRLHLWPKGVMSHALDFMAPILQGWGFHLREETHQWEAPAIVEGYSNYEFDPWTGQITKHTVDIKNPPLFITDLLRQYSVSEAKTALPYGIPLRFQAAEGPESSASLAGATLRGESRRGASTISRAAKAKGQEWPIPQSCEDDFECNGGTANFPLQCCELPLLGKFCCKPPDDDVQRNSKDPAWLPLPVKSVQAALIPAINGMNVVGLVSIPGMMTGQILGGASPMKAAQYQIVILFMISGCTFWAVCMICVYEAYTIQAFFDENGRHDDSAAGILRGLVRAFLVIPSMADVVYFLAFRRAKVLDVLMEGKVGKVRPLKAQFPALAGEVLCIMGPSGVGKSTLLKWIADLSRYGSAKMVVGTRDKDTMAPQEWRREVLYVHQVKAPLPGTPRKLIQALEKLKVRSGLPALAAEPLVSQIGLEESMMERSWSELSGGEGQRMMFAIALSTNPKCLVLDEPTSALDEASKILVEEVLKKRGSDSCVIMVTHDGKQAERVGTSLWTFTQTA
ncbi:fetA [Symbiodinium sp. KB8]|nr:fetA [Symbiodinium sp. KB8]